MTNIDNKFIIIGLVYFLAAMVHGLAMAIAADYGLQPVHAHMALVGGVLNVLYGLVHRAYPAMAGNGLAGTHYWVANTGALIFFGGIVISIADGARKVGHFGAILVILSLIMFLVMFIRCRKA